MYTCMHQYNTDGYMNLVIHIYISVQMQMCNIRISINVNALLQHNCGRISLFNQLFCFNNLNNMHILIYFNRL